MTFFKNTLFKKTAIAVLIFLFGLLAIFPLITNNPIIKENPNNGGDKPPVQKLSFSNNFSWNTRLNDSTTTQNHVSFADVFELFDFNVIGNATTEAQIKALDLSLSNSIKNLVGTKKVSIYTADDLYNLSVAASYNWIYSSSAARDRYPLEQTIQTILSLNYVLQNDIDYSSMKSKQFVPLGLELIIPDVNGNIYYNASQSEDDPLQSTGYAFNGTFDGQGYTISNLYLADYSYITTIYYDDELGDIELPLSGFYSIFASVGTTGTICNLTILNPVLELLESHEDLYKTAVLAGRNRGTIYNTAIIDTKKIGTADNSGIRFYLQSGVPFNGKVSAAGFVHTNEGAIYNSYYVSKNVISPNFVEYFDMEPIVYKNKGTIQNVAYDETVYDNTNNGDVTLISGVVEYTTTELKSGLSAGSDICLNNPMPGINDNHAWYYYRDDGYPVQHGLKYQNGYFQIYNEHDLINMYYMMEYITQYNGISYNRHNYLLMDNIDMKNIHSFQTPGTVFYGSLQGNTSSNANNLATGNKTIANLTISNPYISQYEYYLGLFSVLNGSVNNVNFYNCQAVVANNASYYDKDYYVGLIAGKLERGTINRIIVDAPANKDIINLGTEAIGKVNAGSLFGVASGTISFVTNYGSVNGGIHSFVGIGTIAGIYNVGGIVGATGTSPLTLKSSSNHGTVTGVGSSSNAAGNVKIRTGGLIGYVENLTNTTGNSLYYLTNTGVIAANNFSTNNPYTASQSLGGIFGVCAGIANQITETVSNNVTVKNGSWENIGNIKATVLSSNARETFYTAAIGTAETTTVKGEFYYMVNKGGYNFTNFTTATHNKYIYYSATILDNTDVGITLSRAYNETDFSYNVNYFATTAANNYVAIAPFFVSVNDNGCELLYCQNNGKLTVDNNNQNITYEVRIAGITLANKVSFTNVYKTQDIIVTNFKTATASNTVKYYNIYVAGIAWILSYDETVGNPYTAVSCQTEGTIYTANIALNSTVPTSTTASKTTMYVNNLYVAGMFNINNGEITNSINCGDITSSYDATTLNINGTCNTYVGGLVTVNYNLIQDCANAGNIIYTNSLSSSTFTVYSSTTQAGLLYGFNAGLALGGIACAFGTNAATILAGYGQNISDNSNNLIVAKVIDTANNGNIFGKAANYVRSGGILGVALGAEFNSGTPQNLFASDITGSTDPIGSCILSNGLNYGNISASTSTNITYTNTARPQINGCAGGVIGYGLCVMKEMLNHGMVSSTDVAGGIVGSTYVLGGTGNTTIVDIQSAVHYGKVKAISTAYASINYENVVNGTCSYYTYAQILGTGTALAPQNRRGFGGIFGRLQRGTNGVMRATNFDNIMNCDPDNDFIGRMDFSAMTSSPAYFQLLRNDANYPERIYSARANDTTQALLVGFVVAAGSGTANRRSLTVTSFLSNPNNAEVALTVLRTNTTYSVSKITVYATPEQPVYIKRTHETAGRTASNFTNTTLTARAFSETHTYVTLTETTELTSGYNITVNATNIPGYSTSDFPSSGSTYDYNITSTDYTLITTTTTSTSTSNYIVWPIKKITEDKTDAINSLDKAYIYDESFSLMNVSDDNNIAYAQNDALADRFRLSTGDSYRPNGMYVLSSHLGRAAGAVLPSNLQIDKVYRINEESVTTGDYINVRNVNSDNLMDLNDQATNNMVQSYKQMFQLRYNEQSAIIEQSSDSSLADLILYDPTGQAPTLTGGVIDKINKTVTFTINGTAFPYDNYPVTYLVKSANTSTNAVVAIPGALDNHQSFKEQYQNRSSNIMDGIYTAIMGGMIIIGDTITLSSPTSGSASLTVYSELASEISGLAKYTTDYTIIVTCTNIAFNLNFTSYERDGQLTNLAANTSALRANTINGEVNDTLKCTFTHPVTRSLPIGHTLNIVNLARYDGSDYVNIDEKYYDFTHVGMTSTGVITFTLEMSNLLKNGYYCIYFSVYDNASTVYTINFTKAMSTNYNIVDTNYDTYSSDIAGLQNIFPDIINNNFTTYMEFGKIFSGILEGQNNAVTITGQDISLYEDGSLPDYVSKALYYELYYNGNYLLTIELMPFAHLTSATMYYEYISDNYLRYVISYTIIDEAGVENTITHYIDERPLPEIVVYRGNIIENNIYDIKIEREIIETKFSIYFGFNNTSFNNQVYTLIDNILYEPNFSNEFYTFESLDGFDLLITYALETGVKEYTFLYKRSEDVYLNLGTINIEKLLGTNAYMQNINFQIDGGIGAYPTIIPVDETGSYTPNEVSSYNPRIYYAGIDYVDLDLIGYKYFKIHSNVANIDLEEYHPLMTIPTGAKIERYNPETNSWVENLYANYIGEEEEETLILYRVIPEMYLDASESEIALQAVYYYISATDVLYNLTIRFKVYYRGIDGVIKPAYDSPINGKVVLITSKNYEIDYSDILEADTLPANYPHAGAVGSHITGLITQASQFYIPMNREDYIYTFGRGLSGCYGFSIVTPAYSGVTNDNSINGQRYLYSIYLLTGLTNEADPDLNDYRSTLEQYKLANLDNSGSYDGKYFYINNSTKTRTRVFAIIVEEFTYGNKWGLYDDFTSWH